MFPVSLINLNKTLKLFITVQIPMNIKNYNVQTGFPGNLRQIGPICPEIIEMEKTRNILYPMLYTTSIFKVCCTSLFFQGTYAFQI